MGVTLLTIPSALYADDDIVASGREEGSVVGVVQRKNSAVSRKLKWYR